VRQEIPAREGKKMEDPTESLLVNQRWVAEKGGIPVSTQEDLRRKGLFAPWLRINNRIYYRRTQSEQWIAEQEARATGAVSEPDPNGSYWLDGNPSKAAAGEAR
jgi:hypothetical protein